MPKNSSRKKEKKEKVDINAVAAAAAAATEELEQTRRRVKLTRRFTQLRSDLHEEEGGTLPPQLEASDLHEEEGGTQLEAPTNGHAAPPPPPPPLPPTQLIVSVTITGGPPVSPRALRSFCFTPPAPGDAGGQRQAVARGQAAKAGAVPGSAATESDGTPPPSPQSSQEDEADRGVAVPAAAVSSRPASPSPSLSYATCTPQPATPMAPTVDHATAARQGAIIILS